MDVTGSWISGALVLLLTVAFYVAVGALIVSIGIRISGVGRADPMRILRERLARGEITPAEYEDARRILGR